MGFGGLFPGEVSCINIYKGFFFRAGGSGQCAVSLVIFSHAADIAQAALVFATVFSWLRAMPATPGLVAALLS